MSDTPIPNRRSVSEGFALEDDARDFLMVGNTAEAMRRYDTAAMRFQEDGLFDEAFTAASSALALHDELTAADASPGPSVQLAETMQMYGRYFSAGELLAGLEEHRAESTRELLGSRISAYRHVADLAYQDEGTGPGNPRVGARPATVSQGFSKATVAQSALDNGDIVVAVREFVYASEIFLADERIAEAYAAATSALRYFEEANALAAIDERYRDPNSGQPTVAALTPTEVARIYESFINASEHYALAAEDRVADIQAALAERSATLAQIGRAQGPERNDLGR